jgi:hypothetical protein
MGILFEDPTHIHSGKHLGGDIFLNIFNLRSKRKDGVYTFGYAQLKVMEHMFKT